MTPEGNPELGFIYICLGAMGIGLLGFGVVLVIGLARDFAKLIEMHVRGWK